MREGKVVDALWHLASEPIQATSQNAALAAQESVYLNTIAQVAATAYGGPQGAAAYAAWLTYNQTGSADLALRAGVLTYATSMAFQAAGSLESNTASQLARKAAVTASIGGIAVAAAGGNEQAIRDGFFRAGAMVVVQDGYKRYLGTELDARSSKGEAYCMSAVGEACSPPEAAYVRDSNGTILRDSQGLPVVDMSKVDPRIPHVGKWSGPTAANWTQEPSVFMTSVSRIPGMNAMSLFHDQWSVSWDMGSITNAATIVPAIVLTYTGTGTDYYDLLQKTVVANGKTAAEATVTPITVIAPPASAAPGSITASEPPVVQLPLNALRSNSALFSAICTGDSGSHRILIEVTEPHGTACRVITITPTDAISVIQSSGQIGDCVNSAHSHIQQLVHSKLYCFTRDTTGRIDGESAPPELSKAVNEKLRRPFPGWSLQTIGATFLTALLVVGAIFGFFSGWFWQNRKHHQVLTARQ